MKILEFTTRANAQSSLATINAMAAMWWQSQGFTVIDNQLVGRINGIDAPESTRTISWAVEVESPDGTWYFSSLSNDPRFPDWKETYEEFEGITYIEKDMPDNWNIVSDA